MMAVQGLPCNQGRLYARAPRSQAPAGPTCSTRGQSLQWLRYLIHVGGPLDDAPRWEIQYWSIGAQTCDPNQPSPPADPPKPANSTPWLPVLSQDFEVQPFGPTPSRRIPAGSFIKIELATNASGQVSTAMFGVTDPTGTLSEAPPFSFPAHAVFPVDGFQVNLVGPCGGASCNFLSGTGILRHAVSGGMRIVRSSNTHGGPRPPTGVLHAAESMVSRSFNFVW